MPKKDDDKKKDKDDKEKNEKEQEKETENKSASTTDSSSSKENNNKDDSKKDSDSDDIRKKIKTEVVTKEEKDDEDDKSKDDPKETEDKKDKNTSTTSDVDTDKSPDKSKEEKKKPDKPLPTIPSFSMLDQKTSITDKPEAEPDTDDKDEPAKENAEEKSDEKKMDTKKKEDISSDEVKEWLKDVRPDTSKESHKGGRPTMKIVLIVLMVLALLAAVVGGIFYYRQGVEGDQESVTDEETEVLPTTPPSEPSPTPAGEVTISAELSEYSVNVLNGSGVAGEAGTVADLLGEAGFEGIDAGNADSYDYTDTEVQTKEDTPDAVYGAIEEALSDDYVVVRSDETLDEDSEYDVVVTVGSSSPDAE